MIKRTFYRQEHGERDEGSDSSSSSSDSDVEVQSTDASEEAGEELEEAEPHHDLSSRVKLHAPSPSSSSSGYESENSSADELDADSSGLPVDDEVGSGVDQHQLADSHKNDKAGMVERLAQDGSLPDEAGRCILKCKSVFKCRLCPKIVCLNEETLKAHLQSKRHARSEKLLSNGRLKLILNTDGEEEVLEEDGETHAERHARILALAQEKTKKKTQGRQRQRLRSKRKKEGKKLPTLETGQNAKRRRPNV